MLEILYEMQSLEKMDIGQTMGFWKIKVGKENRNVNTKGEGFFASSKRIKQPQMTRICTNKFFRKLKNTNRIEILASAEGFSQAQNG